VKFSIIYVRDDKTTVGTEEESSEYEIGGPGKGSA
jgi:hypothetical protein